MDFFLQPFWYNEYEKTHFEYYSRLEYFKQHAKNDFSEAEIKGESDQLNILHHILNKIRYQYNSYFCSEYKDFENLFDISIKHKYHTLNEIPIINNNDIVEKYEINLINL